MTNWRTIFSWETDERLQRGDRVRAIRDLVYTDMIISAGTLGTITGTTEKFFLFYYVDFDGYRNKRLVFSEEIERDWG